MTESDKTILILLTILLLVCYLYVWGCLLYSTLKLDTTEPDTTETKTNVCEDNCTTHWYYHAGLKMMQPYIVCNECEKE